MKSVSRKKGFTLIELMVVMVISSLLLTVLVGIFSQSSSSLSLATNRLDLTGRARVPADKAAFYISSAIEAGDRDGIMFPPTGLAGVDDADSTTWPRHLVFETTEDFCETSYSPDRTLTEFGTGFYIFGQPPIFQYVLWYETGDGGMYDNYPGIEGALMLMKLTDPGLTGAPLDAWLADPFANLEATDANTKERLVGGKIEDIRFNHITSNLVQLRVRTQGQVKRAQGQMETQTYDYDAVVQLPTFSLSD
jgi:prepilin-type N-terminal cleavage/methylation domain-containing protein